METRDTLDKLALATWLTRAEWEFRRAQERHDGSDAARERYRRALLELDRAACAADAALGVRRTTSAASGPRLAEESAADGAGLPG